MKKLLVLFAIPLMGFACAPNPESQSNSVNTNSVNANAVADHGQMNHEAMNHSEMNHAEMKSAPNAASAPYDLQFLDTMMAHHQGAVEMAKMIQSRTQNAELRKFGAQVVVDQEKEIAQMKNWRQQWFAGKNSALNMEMPGMADSMKMDMSKLSAAKNGDFDRAFVEMMIPHHQGAVTMSQEALTKAEHPAIKTLSTQIIEAQQAEIEKMQGWKKAWAK